MSYGRFTASQTSDRRKQDERETTAQIGSWLPPNEFNNIHNYSPLSSTNIARPLAKQSGRGQVDETSTKRPNSVLVIVAAITASVRARFSS